MSTLKDLLGDATRGDGRKFTHTQFKGRMEWVEFIYKDSSQIWHGITNDGEWWTECATDSGWSEWVEPKKKVTRWLWTCKRGASLSSFAADHLELSAREYGRSEEVSLKTIEENWIKLPWSATEFDS